MSLSRYFKSYKLVSYRWCVGLTFDSFIGLRNLKTVSTDFLEPSGSRTTARSGTLGPIFPFISMNTEKRQQIRTEIRKIRANLTALQQQQAEQSVTQQALNLIGQRQAKNIALYFSLMVKFQQKP